MTEEGKPEVHVYVIVPAAGQSRRMGVGTNKQFLLVAGVPVLARTLLAFSEFEEAMRQVGPFVLHVVVVTSQTLLDETTALIKAHNIHFVEATIAGGETRQESVFLGIQALARLPRPPVPEDIVFVHDGARCFVNKEILHRCLCGATDHGICAAAVPVKDTIKQVVNHSGGKVQVTPDRESLFAVQTPQAFRYQLLVESYLHAKDTGIIATDDTSLAESLGFAVYLVEGAYRNVKITTPEDLLFAKLLLEKKEDDRP